MANVYKTLYEFLANSPIKPGKPAPTKPATPAKPAPQRPSPIRRDKPSTTPKPQASETDIYNRFIDVLKKAKSQVKVNKSKLK